MPETRVAVFIDHQNVYNRARDAFCVPSPESHVDGQFDPYRLGLHLAGGRKLETVRVYRGLPSPKHDHQGYAATDRQLGMWANKAS